MFKYVLLAVLVAVASAAPAADPKPDPIAAPHAAAHAAPAPAPKIEASSASEAESQPGPVIAASVAAAAAAPAPVPAAKQLLLAELPLAKTPASTGKLTPIGAPVLAPLSPLAYAAPTILAPYPTWNGLAALPAALPATYSIEQHGYHITY